MFVHLSFVLKLYSTRFVLAQLAAFGASFDSRSVCCRGIGSLMAGFDGGVKAKQGGSSSDPPASFASSSCLPRRIVVLKRFDSGERMRKR